MGTFGDHGGGWPHDGDSPDDLPDLPAEWGVIVIPDDLSGLSHEVRAVRAELRLTRPRTPWQRFLARPGMRSLRRLGAAGARGPVLIVALAILVTAASLFASAWSGPVRSPAAQRSTGVADDRGDTLPALQLLDTDGSTVSLRSQLPAVVLLIDGCDCARLVRDTTDAVRPGITVLTVTSAAPPVPGTVPPTGVTPQSQGKTVRALRDPTGTLRRELRLAEPDSTAAAVLVNRSGEIVRRFPRTASVLDLRPDLARL